MSANQDDDLADLLSETGEDAADRSDDERERHEAEEEEITEHWYNRRDL